MKKLIVGLFGLSALLSMPAIALPPGNESVAPTLPANAVVPGQRSITIPKGPSSSRTTIPKTGELRFNTTFNGYEGWDGSSWTPLGAGASTPVFATWSTAGRPGSPFTGQAGYNTTIGSPEYWNGLVWVQNSGAPVPAITNGVVYWDGSKFVTIARLTYDPLSGSGLLQMTATSGSNNKIALGPGGLPGSSTIALRGQTQSQIGFEDGAGVINFFDSTNTYTSQIRFTAPTATRFFTLPNADSNPIQPATAPAGQFVNAVSSAGVLSFGTPSAARVTTASYSSAGTAIEGFNFTDATSGAFSLALPTAVGNAGEIIEIKKVDASVNAVTVTSAQTIDGSASYMLVAQNQALAVISDGSNWKIK